MTGQIGMPGRTGTGVTEVADRVWVARYPQWDVNVGVVAGAGADDPVLVVDTRAGLRQCRETAELVRSLVGERPVRWAVNTHVHFDHSFGNAAFTGARVIAHDHVARAWDAAARGIRAAFRADPHAAPELGYDESDVEDVLTSPLRPPELTFSQAATIELGAGRRVRLGWAGRGHTDGDLRIDVVDGHLRVDVLDAIGAGPAGAADAPAPVVSFLGDLVEESGPPSAGPDAFPDEWPATLRAHLRSIGPHTLVVPGHGSPVDRDFVVAQAAQLAESG